MILALLTRDSPLDSCTMFGITRTLASRAPRSISWPASTWSSSMMPETWGLIRISLRGTTDPVATVLWTMSVRTGETVA